MQSNKKNRSKKGQVRVFMQEDSLPANYKTSLCTHYEENGYCFKGDNCTYAHGRKELRQPNQSFNKIMVKGSQYYDDEFDGEEDFYDDEDDYYQEDSDNNQ